MTSAAPLTGTPVRLVTLNTWKCDGAYALRLQAMATQLGTLAPDVVALQESYASLDGVHDTARDLALALGLHRVLAPARTKPRVCEGVVQASHSGMALLSRWPIARHTVLVLPSAAEDGERLALLCQLQAGHHRLTVANAHLTHLEGADALRHQQLHNVLEHPWLHDPRDAAMVCGDFNVPLQSDALRGFITPLGVWVDAAQAAGLHDKVTCPTPGGTGLDLDHVLSRAAAPLRWRRARVVLDQPDATTGVCPSDHHALCVDGHLLP